MKFGKDKSLRILMASLVVGALLYLFLTLLSVSAYPSRYPNWFAYISNLDSHEGYASIPAFYAAKFYLGDVGVALLAGMMIIPTIYVFEGIEGMKAGPSLMFVSLPKVFESMYGIGRFVGLAFFLMAAFAALTSCVSVLETITANCMQVFHTKRHPTTIVLTLIYTAASVIISLGYSLFYLELPLPNGSIGQLLDLMDYISNSVMMPFISLLAALLIGWVVGPGWIVEEVEYGGKPFSMKRCYSLMIRFAVPVIMFILFLVSTGVFNI